MSCSIEGCGRTSVAHGWCGKHYQRWVKWGDPTYSIYDHPETSFRRKVSPTLGGCWIWNGGRYPTGYGQVHLKGYSQYAHRAAYELFVGPIPDGAELHHSCRYKRCVKPAHLTPMTPEQHTQHHREAVHG